MSDQPNILLLMTDQQRGDCLGIAGHPVVQTPYLDHLAASGTRFRRAYTACPVCIPARRTLMTGQTPFHHGVMMNYDTRLEGPTLPGELTRAGYQAHLVGKLHLWPHRKLHGFSSADWSDGPGHGGDYDTWLVEQGVLQPHAGLSHGADRNGYVARPWHLEERLHFTNWCADKALEFLRRRDPTVPFFLNVSFHQPHQPCCPPQAYYDRYLQQDLGEPYVGAWARVYDDPQRGLPVAAWRAALPPQVLRQYRAGYYGCINHIDDQIGRILQHVPGNTIIVFLSDHGEMLGDHQWIRKRNAFEPSAHIPLIIRLPRHLQRAPQVRDEPVELMDVMPTLLEAAGVPIPATVDGASLLGLANGRSQAWRDYLHGECADVPSLGSGMQYVTDGRQKYIWYPGTGAEQYFDLEHDPREMVNRVDHPACEAAVAVWRQRLVERLAGRPEGFTDGTRLCPIGRASPFVRPGLERQG